MCAIDKTDLRNLTALCGKRIMEAGAESKDSVIALIEEEVFSAYPWEDMGFLYLQIQKVYGMLRGSLGSLSYLLEDKKINEIMANAPDSVFIEKEGSLRKIADGFIDREEMNTVIRKMAGRVHREINEKNPILDARLSDGSRVHAVLGNVAIGGPALTIRKFSGTFITVREMVKNGSIPSALAQDLKCWVEAGYNIFVSGGTSSGKTTFLNALSGFIPPRERVIVIEDSLELQLPSIANIVRLEVKNANAAGEGAVQMNDLIKASLRMRPDRILVGEVRGKEVSDMLQALNTGHSGMSTGHGNSVRGMLRRLEAMYLSGSDMPLDAVRMQIGEAIEIMVHMQRSGDGRRKVVEVQELMEYRNGDYLLHPLYLQSGELLLQKTDELNNNGKLKLLAEK